MTSLNNPKASSVASQGVKFRALSPQISFSETRFSFVIPGRPANAYSLDQTVASIAAMKTRENPGTNGMIPPLEHSVFPPFTGMDKIYRRLQVHPAETLALADMEARADAYELNRKSDTILGQEKTDVAKIMKCRSVGLDCDFVAHGETEAQVMEKVAQHAKKDHGMHDIPEDVATKVRAAIRDE